MADVTIEQLFGALVILAGLGFVAVIFALALLTSYAAERLAARWRQRRRGRK